MKTINQWLQIFFSIIIFSSSIFSIQFPGDEWVQNGVDLFYNYETDEAVSLLSEARVKFPENPRVHFTWVAARMLNHEANQPIKESYIQLEHDLNEVIPILEQLNSKHPDHPEYQLYLGSAIGLKARINLGKKEWLSTLINAFRGFRIIRKIEINYPEIIDAKLPIGIVEYFAGLNPGFLQWTAKLFGLEATKQAGLKKIETAAQFGEFSYVEAKKIYIFLNLWVENKPDLLLKFSKDLHQNYPQNFFFNIMYLESKIKYGNLDEIPPMFLQMETALEKLTPIQKLWYKSYLAYEQALYHFLCDNYNSALEFVDISIKEYHAELDVILAHAFLLKGKIHDVKNEREKAKQSYKDCVALDNYTYAINEAKNYLKVKYKK